jgi:hypothetical protein
LINLFILAAPALYKQMDSVAVFKLAVNWLTNMVDWRKPHYDYKIKQNYASGYGLGYPVCRWWLTGSYRSQIIDCKRNVCAQRRKIIKILKTVCIPSKIGM